MEHWWNYIGTGKPNYLDKNQSQCHKWHMVTDLGSNPGLRGERPVTKPPNEPELYLNSQIVRRSKRIPSRLLKSQSILCGEINDSSLFRDPYKTHKCAVWAERRMSEH